MDYRELVEKEFDQAQEVFNQFIADKSNFDTIIEAATCIVSAIKSGGKILTCGNGGSHCDAMHFAEELSGRYRENRQPFPAMAISDPSHITCVGNDFGYEFVFSRFIEAIGQTDDVLLGLSTSGNSKNIIRAFEAAKSKGMKTILLSGSTGGSIAPLADIKILVPHTGFADRVQEIHIKCIHAIILLIEEMMNA